MNETLDRWTPTRPRPGELLLANVAERQRFKLDASGAPPCCARCDRRGYLNVRGEWLCDWHCAPRLPLSVRNEARTRTAKGHR